MGRRRGLDSGIGTFTRPGMSRSYQNHVSKLSALREAEKRVRDLQSAIDERRKVLISSVAKPRLKAIYCTCCGQLIQYSGQSLKAWNTLKRCAQCTGLVDTDRRHCRTCGTPLSFSENRDAFLAKTEKYLKECAQRRFSELTEMLEASKGDIHSFASYFRNRKLPGWLDPSIKSVSQLYEYLRNPESRLRIQKRFEQHEKELEIAQSNDTLEAAVRKSWASKSSCNECQSLRESPQSVEENAKTLLAKDEELQELLKQLKVAKRALDHLERSR